MYEYVPVYCPLTSFIRLYILDKIINFSFTRVFKLRSNFFFPFFSKNYKWIYQKNFYPQLVSNNPFILSVNYRYSIKYLKSFKLFFVRSTSSLFKITMCVEEKKTISVNCGGCTGRIVRLSACTCVQLGCLFVADHGWRKAVLSPL